MFYVYLFCTLTFILLFCCTYICNSPEILEFISLEKIYINSQVVHNEGANL